MVKSAARRIELLADHGAALCLGGAVAFAATAALGPIFMLVAPAAYWLAHQALGRIRPRRAVKQSIAALPVASPAPVQDNERVVRLFTPAIVQGDPSLRTPAADASQALHDAMNELRRSLR